MKTWSRALLPAVSLLALVAIVYLPAFGGEFVWDDLLLVHQNPLVKGDFDLRSIWFQSDFPLANIALWLQWLAWGEHAAGYHVVNISLHALNSVLAWMVLRKMQVRGAWVGAALFAIHPVCVASAAWISEIKNTLSLTFYLIAFHSWLLANPQPESHPGPAERSSPGSVVPLWYTLSLVTFVLALLTKTSTVMFPVTQLLWLLWFRNRLTRRDVARTIPFFLLSLGFGLATIWMQTNQVIRGELVQTEPLWARAILAVNATWFYAFKAVLPLQLNMIYPRGELRPESLLTWLPLLLSAAVLWIFWRYRKTWGGHAFFGAAFFAVNLFPVLGFFDMYYLAISRVSDHFQYLPILGLLAVFGSGLASIHIPRLQIGVILIVLLGFSFLAFQRAGIIASDEKLWRDTLSRNDQAWTAHNNLGCILAEKQDLTGAIRHFERSVQLNPRNARAHGNLAQALAIQGQAAEAEPHFRDSLSLKPEAAEVHRNYASALQALGRTSEAVQHLQESIRLNPDADASLELAGILLRSGQPAKAVTALNEAIRLRPQFPEALNNLAWVLSTCADESVRDSAQGLALATQACKLTDSQHPVYVATLAAALANTGRFEEAITASNQALELTRKTNNRQFAGIIQILIRRFEARQPWREPVRTSGSGS